MKILIAAPLGKITFELSKCFQKAFVKLGHSCRRFNYCYNRVSSRIKLPFIESLELSLIGQRFFRAISKYKPEFVFVINGLNFSPQIITKIRQKLKVTTAFFSTDDPYFTAFSSQLSPAYDYCFTNEPACLPIHKQAGCSKVKFLSFACAPEIHKKIDLTNEEMKQYGSDVVFVGGMSPYRMRILETLTDFDLKIWSPLIIKEPGDNLDIIKKPVSPSSPIYNKFTGRSAWDEEMVKVYNASKIVLNIYQQIKAEVNIRIFEGTGCGAFTLTEKKGVLPGLFRNKEEIVWFEDTKELRELIKYYLGHQEERNAIAQKGRERAYRDHTYFQKAKELLSFIAKD